MQSQQIFEIPVFEYEPEFTIPQGVIAIESSTFLLQKNTDLILTSISVGSLIAGFLILENDPVELEELATLNNASIPAFENHLISFDTIQALRAEKLSDQFMFTSGVAGIASVFLTKNGENDLKNNLVMYVEGLTLTVGITEILKKSTDRKRPYVYNKNLTDEQRTDEESSMSFPSGHTSFSAFNSFFTASLVSRYLLSNKNIVAKIFVYAGAAGIPAFTGYFRTEAGKHFWTDVSAGYLLGASIGVCIPLLHKSENENVSFKPLLNEEIQGLSCNIKFSKLID